MVVNRTFVALNGAVSRVSLGHYSLLFFNRNFSVAWQKFQPFKAIFDIKSHQNSRSKLEILHYLDIFKTIFVPLKSYF